MTLREESNKARLILQPKQLRLRLEESLEKYLVDLKQVSKDYSSI